VVGGSGAVNVGGVDGGSGAVKAWDVFCFFPGEPECCSSSSSGRLDDIL